jgi:hypothetical protein
MKPITTRSIAARYPSRVDTLHARSAYPAREHRVPRTRYAFRRLPRIGKASDATPTIIFVLHGRPSQKPMAAASAGESRSVSFWK